MLSREDKMIESMRLTLIKYVEGYTGRDLAQLELKKLATWKNEHKVRKFKAAFKGRREYGNATHLFEGRALTLKSVTKMCQDMMGSNYTCFVVKEIL